MGLGPQSDVVFLNTVDQLTKAGATAMKQSKQFVQQRGFAPQTEHAPVADRSTPWNILTRTSASTSHPRRMLALDRVWTIVDATGRGRISLDDFMHQAIILAGYRNSHFDKQTR